VTNFRAVAKVTGSNIITNIPQNSLPALVQLARKAKNQPLQSISFDPALPNPHEQDGWFNPAQPDLPYMRQVVQNAIKPQSAPATSRIPSKTTTTGPPSAVESTSIADANSATGDATSVTTATDTAPETSLENACYT
jgi:hypothetical protein